MSFSALDRTSHLASLMDTHWDLMIIGGGITGAGILLDAVTRGLKVALIEMQDFASGTSSKSTKLIHGGLRYLKNFEIGLVREVGKERAIVYSNARHLVRPEPMLLPIYQEGSIGRITGSIGLWFYDLLADVDKSERRRMLSLEETLAQEPLLRREGLLGSGLYYEYRTDDARLTLSILRKAVELDGLALNYCQATGFLYSNEHIAGVQCKDTLTGNVFNCAARVVVNATGPWTEEVMGFDAESNDKKLLLSKGIHIVIPLPRIPVNQSLYFDMAEDGRMIFVIPRGNAVYIGTTDTSYEGPLDTIEVKEEEIAYLLRGVNHRFNGDELKAEDVIGSWAGLRPLIYSEGKSPGELSRRDEIFQSPTGLISIAGGKLTGYRKMAERIINLIVDTRKFEIPHAECKTENIRLAGADFDSEEQLHEYFAQLCSSFPLFPRADIARLFYRYGRDTDQILPDAGTEVSLIEAEVLFSIQHEMSQHISDFIFRRTSDIYFDQEYLARHLKRIQEVFERIGMKSSGYRQEELTVINKLFLNDRPLPG